MSSQMDNLNNAQASDTQNSFEINDRPVTDVSEVVYKMVSDMSRRKRNVIVAGIPENQTVSDREQFLNICSDHLSAKKPVVKLVSDSDCILVMVKP